MCILFMISVADDGDLQPVPELESTVQLNHSGQGFD